MPDYLPSTDLGLLAWGDNFASLITAAPGTYGLVAGDAAAIQDATALQTALDPLLVQCGTGCLVLSRR